MKRCYQLNNSIKLFLYFIILTCTTTSLGEIYAADVTVEGRLMVHVYGKSSSQPVRNAKIKIYDEEIIEYAFVGWGRLPWGDEYIKTIYTNNDGYFSTTINNNDGETVIGNEHGRDIYLKVISENSRFNVKNNPPFLFGGPYEFKTSTKKDITSGADFGTIYPVGVDMELAFQILSDLDLAWEFVRDTTGIEIAKANVFYKDLFTPSSSYCFPQAIGDVFTADPSDLPQLVTDIINIAPIPLTAGLIDELAGLHMQESSVKSEGFQTVLFHEYGHFVMDEIGDFYPPFTVLLHYVDQPYDREHAFQEGWAHFFSCAVKDYYGLSFITYITSNVNSETNSLSGDDVEGSIAQAFWDFYDDTPGETIGDNLNLGFSEIVSVITNYDPNLIFSWPFGADHPWDIYDFHIGYATTHAYSPSVGEMWTQLENMGINVPDDENPVNPTGYTSTHGAFIGNPDTTIEVDLTGAHDTISGIEAYYYEWDQVPDTELSIWENTKSTIPHIAKTGATPGNWYLHLFVKDNAGNYPAAETHFGPFLVGDTSLVMLDGTFTNWLGQFYITGETQVTLKTATYKGKSYTNPKFQMIIQGQIEGETKNYSTPFTLSDLEDGLFTLKIKGTETETGNEETLEELELNIDNTEPALTLTYGNPNWSSGPIFITKSTEFTITGTDTGSGIAETQYRITNNSSYDTGWIPYTTPFQLLTEPSGLYNIMARASDNIGNTKTEELSIYIDNISPSIELKVEEPKVVETITYVTTETLFSIKHTDTMSGIAESFYNVTGPEYDPGLETYAGSFTLPAKDGPYTISVYTYDNLGNEASYTHTTITNDNNGPILDINPTSNTALQNTVSLNVKAIDQCGVKEVKLTIRRANAPDDQIGLEDLALTYDPVNMRWETSLNTIDIEDGHYLFTFTAIDRLDNENTEIMQYSIRNWEIAELLPNSKQFKTGRTIPIKFTLEINANVDPTTPFVYNEELLIEISKKDGVLQSSVYGDTNRDYRIDAPVLYITNFKTDKTPDNYTVSLYNQGILIGSFEFETTRK